jgi:ubiquinone biosynthesis protein
LRKQGVRLYVALVKKSIEDVTKQLLLIGKPSNSTDIESFKKEVNDIVSGWHGTELRRVRVTHMLHQLFDSCIKHDIKMPVDMILLGKALVTAEGTGVMLNSKFNFVKESHKYVESHVKKKLITMESFQVFLNKSRDMAEVLEMIPSEALAVLSKLKHGVIKIDIEDTDLRRLALDIDKSSNRLSYSLVLAALIISGAMMMHANVGPYYKGFSVPAMILYIIAAFMSLTLMVSILKEGAVWR